ncbi:MAG: HAD-IIIA family hydrolase [Candidatus Omnitrophica bacterium]|nr:HAD-IIIA family hydrolase [Candidatus Omnitrophota bacterium]MDD5027721.1 HAD-IIIA family hydrolase [Candidatus Omnitrophota bacterium]MDD5662514.1 HAD-IIIA family hydrolase [Candidatus Omnitrophota bacterium]
MPQKIIFLDRDGVINKYPGDKLYVTSLKKFYFLPGAKKAIAQLTRAGFKVFVASNQAGVGRGIYERRTLEAITRKMLLEIEKTKGKIGKVYYCLHRRDAGCSCRKPRPGLLKKAAREFNFNLKNACFIGDTIRDVLTARAAGCKSVLVLCGKEKLANRKNWEAAPDFVFKNLQTAADFLIKQH